MSAYFLLCLLFILVLLRPHLPCACVYVTGVNQSLQRTMFYCVRAFRVFIWFTKVVGLQSKHYRYSTEDNNTLLKK